MSTPKYVLDDLLEDQIWSPNIFQKIALNVLAAGVVPNHVAIILDGNRRWAKERKLDLIKGHIEGVKTFDRCKHWLDALGVKEVTMYLLSSDNFKRTKEEVKGLIELFTAYAERYLKNPEIMKNHGAKVYFVGDIEMMPKKLRSLLSKLVLATRDNTKTRMNIAMAYKSTDEIDNVMTTIKTGVKEKDVYVEDIDEKLVEKCLYTAFGSPPDMLIRTSGEIRYSDFYLWQLTHKPLYFCDMNWPDFSFTSFCKAMLFYQRNYYKSNAAKIKCEKEFEKRQTEESKSRIEKFHRKREKEFLEKFEKYANES